MTPSPGKVRPRTVPLSILALCVAVALLGGALVWAIVVGPDDEAPPEADSAAMPIVHVHGLGVNPADDAVIVATHTGSFRLPADGGEPERLGDSFQDTMGFTVAGPDHFLGSGHPDVAGLQAGDPTRLGLTESTDGGLTWAIQSLGDEVDFHGLAFAHGRVYGWDSGTSRFMVSTDKREWETRASPTGGHPGGGYPTDLVVPVVAGADALAAPVASADVGTRGRVGPRRSASFGRRGWLECDRRVLWTLIHRRLWPVPLASG